MTAAVEAEAVVRRFPGGRGLGPADLRADGGEVLAIMGPNGSGKTTLLRLLAGVDRPQSGRVLWEGTPDAAAARRSLGLALDATAEEETLSGRQCAYFWCRQWVRDAARARSQVGAALERFGLGGVADEPVAAYSYGMRRRLALVEALAHQPRLALLDEPTAGLDPAGAAALREELRARAAAGWTTVVASNDPPFVQTACDRVALLDSGSLLRVDSPRALVGEAASTRVAELRLRGTPDRAALAAAAGAGSVEATARGARVRFRGDLLAAIVAAADTPAGTLESVTVREADLRDVFEHLTGRPLEASA